MLFQNISQDYFFKRILKQFISLRMIVINFINDYEYFIFYIIISRRLKSFREELKDIKSMNNLINSHLYLTKEIYKSIHMNEVKYIL